MGSVDDVRQTAADRLTVTLCLAVTFVVASEQRKTAVDQRDLRLRRDWRWTRDCCIRENRNILNVLACKLVKTATYL